MTPSKFDRLYATRRNRRLRNLWAATAAGSFFVASLIGLDPLFSGMTLQTRWFLLFALVFVVSLPTAIYYHLKVQSRE